MRWALKIILFPIILLLSILIVFLKFIIQVRTSVDDNGKEHSNVRILSSKLLKAKEQMKSKEEKEKPSVFGQIKKYQAEDKAKLKGKKEVNKEAER